MRYVIGDIHGCLKSLKKLMKKLPVKKEDELIFVGDYIDRGSDSKGVVDFLVELSNKYKCIFLRGNHEQMLLDYLDDKKLGRIWYLNGMDATLKSYGDINSIPKDHLDFFRSTEFYYLTGDYLIVHAGLVPGKPLEEQDKMELIWIREEFIYCNKPLNSKIIVFGHTPFLDGPYFDKTKIGIDTGCVYGGKLTAIRLEDREYFQVNCSR
ncbi:MAG: metallophosphoesterase family protein [Kosmotogaceae bacterium]